MARPFSEAGLGRFVRGVALGGAGIACVALIVAFVVDRPLDKLLGGLGLDFLIGLVAVLLISSLAYLISWAVSAVRCTGFAAPSGTVVERLTIVHVSVQLAALPAVLLLLWRGSRRRH